MERGSAARGAAPSGLSAWKVAAAIVLLAQGAGAQKVRVEEELEAYPTESVDLRCMFIDREDSTKLTQVSWIWEPVDGQRENIAVFHPTYGQSFPNLAFRDRVIFLQNSWTTDKQLKNPSIRIKDLRMSDAGRYTCEYATYPSGNEQGTTTLTMLAKPKNSAKVVTVQASSKSVVVAQCEAVDGKPPATIKWLASVGGNHSTTTMNGPDGTVTVRSEYRLVPTAADNDREVTCMVEQRTQERPWAQTLKLSVEYPPTVSIDGYDNNWYVGRSDAVLLCLANANPAPNVTWTSTSGRLPDTVEVDDNRLTVRKVDYAVNTTFVCEVRNKHGASRHQLTTFVIEALEDPSSTGVVAGAVIGSLLALLLVVTLVAVLLTRSRRQQRRGFPSSGDSLATGSSGGSNGADYGNKARLLFSGAGNGGKNGTGANNNGPIYTYREGCDATGTLTENPNFHHHHHLHHTSTSNPPTAHDILLCGDMDEAERRKFELNNSMEEEEERYDRFVNVGGGGNMLPPAYHPHRGHGGEAEMDVYLDDDMESQRDGSVISRTAIYV